MSEIEPQVSEINPQPETKPELDNLAALAKVNGELIADLPEDLYIPPDALEVILETFEGPLDLLLYLIRKHNLDILNIPIAEITEQYMQYIALMGELQLELAAEYLLMAAMLAEIKSRMLLPRQAETEEEENDPRAELVRRLQEYERYKKAAEDLDELPRQGRDIFIGNAEVTDLTINRPLPNVKFEDLIKALNDVLKRTALNAHHQIEREPLSIRERMSTVLDCLRGQKMLGFAQLFSLEEGRMGVVVTFIAILELTKQSMIQIVQAETLGAIYVQAVTEIMSESNE